MPICVILKKIFLKVSEMDERQRYNRRSGRNRNFPDPRRRPAARPPRAYRQRRPKVNANVATARLMRQRRRGINYSISVVSVMFFSFILVYLAWSAIQFFQPSVATEVVRMDVLEVQLFTPAMIVRDERVYRADISGTVVSHVRDFVRVREGDLLVSVLQDVDAIEAIQAARREIEDQAIGIHGRRFHSPAANEIYRINTSLRGLMDSGLPDFSQLNLAEIYLLNERLVEQTEFRNQTIINSIRPVMQDIDRELNHADLVENLHLHDIVATQGGLFSPFIDGLENTFTPFTVRYLSRADTLHVVDHAAITPAREVEEGEPVFKIVGNTWYVVAYLPMSEVEGFALHQNRTIFLESEDTGRFEPVSMRVVHMYSYVTDVFIIFRSSRNVDRFLNQRNVNVRITDNVQNGLRIPTTAIATRNLVRVPISHLHGVEGNHFIQRFVGEGVTERVNVFVNNTSGYYAYILNEGMLIAVGDVLAPFDLDFGSYILWDTNIITVRGVFRANLGVAEFRQIFLEEEIPDTGVGHVILNPARNRGLMQFDTIVTDASAVREGDLVN